MGWSACRPRPTARSSRATSCWPSTNTRSATRSTCCAPSPDRNYCRYEIERQGILKNVGIDIDPVFTPFSYYILVFVGILAILLTLGILNIYVKQATLFPPPQIFFILSLTLSGFLIFSPTRRLRPSRFHFPDPGHGLLHLLPGRAAAVRAAVPAAQQGLQKIQRQFPLPADLPAAAGHPAHQPLFHPAEPLQPRPGNPDHAPSTISAPWRQKYFALYVFLAWVSDRRLLADPDHRKKSRNATFSPWSASR